MFPVRYTTVASQFLHFLFYYFKGLLATLTNRIQSLYYFTSISQMCTLRLNVKLANSDSGH